MNSLILATEASENVFFFPFIPSFFCLEYVLTYNIHLIHQENYNFLEYSEKLNFTIKFILELFK